jgi:uncharacterized low-complexity protein
MTKTTILTRLGGALLLTAVFAVPAFAEDKIAETTAEHQKAADDLKTKAKEHKAESEMHSRMAEMYGAKIKGPHNQKPNAWLINMVKHCKKMAAKAGELSALETKAAEQHEAEAKAGS